MRLELGLVLGLLQDGLHLHGLHHVAADLELAAHEEALGVLLAGDEVTEVFLGELERNYRTISLDSDNKYLRHVCSSP